MNQQVNMNANVELHVHSDYLPLNQFAAQDSVQRIQVVSATPDAPPPPAPARSRAPDTGASDTASPQPGAKPAVPDAEPEPVPETATDRPARNCFPAATDTNTRRTTVTTRAEPGTPRKCGAQHHKPGSGGLKRFQFR